MSSPDKPDTLSPVLPSRPILGVPFDPRVVEGPHEEAAFDLKGYLNTLFDNLQLIGGITAFVTLVALVYAVFAKPVYEANLMIHVEEHSPNASKNFLSEASSLFETKKAAITEIELLRSRMVIARTADTLHLYVDVQPKHFPIAGFWFSNMNSKTLSRPGLFGYGGYVWGAEKAEVCLFEVPDGWLGREFTLTALGKQRYRFSGGGQGTVFDGQVGLRYRVPTPEGVIELKVDRMDANPGARFRLRRMSRHAVVEAVQKALMITEHGKQSGIIEVKLQGDNARSVFNLLSEIGREYMRQNLAHKTQQAEATLAYLNRQLPILKRQLEQAEDRYSQFRNEQGTVNMKEETRTLLAQIATARSRRIDLTQKQTELLARFTMDHPLVAALDRQRKQLETQIEGLNARIKALPELEQNQARLARDIKVDTDLYTDLSNSAQQLRLSSIGRVSNVRMVDAPTEPEKPIKPNRPLIVALAAIAGLFLGILVAFVRKMTRGRIDDPNKLERLLRASVVYATIPHSSTQDKLVRKAKKGDSWPLLARVSPEDPAVESLRGFRVALHFSMPHFRNNIVMIAGPTRGLGKSFVSANFAAVMTASGRRVLLIDADLRNGQLHRYFDVGRERGLASAILGNSSIDEVVHHNVLENLDFIPTGELAPNRPEFLLRLTFGHLLQRISANYDLVLLDPPPVLQVADALIFGAHAGAVFLVTRSALTTEWEISESIKRLNHAGISPYGVLFNGVASRRSPHADYASVDARSKPVRVPHEQATIP